MTSTLAADRREEEETNSSTTSSYFQQTDEEFQAWVLGEMTTMAPQLLELYPATFPQVSEAVGKWRQRFRGDTAVWNRLFKPDRVLKEVVEAVPVVQVVLDWMECHDATSKKITIVDLCSGKGYLSMLLSEMLSPERVGKCLLIDKAWPLCHAQPKPHHMNWEHIYGNPQEEARSTYFESWPIPLVTSKQDLKQSRTIQQLKDRFEGPVLILAVHLCGTLSLQGIKLFLETPSSQMLVLKPCCLPAPVQKDHSPMFQVGTYCFPTADVCATGKWTSSKRVWEGPPRWHLQPKFQNWCRHLHQSMQQQDGIIQTKVLEVPLQTKGGFQNTYLIAERIR